jgi:hypothetical protein
MGSDGCIQSQGTVSEVLAKSHDPALELIGDKYNLEKRREVVDEPPSNSKPPASGKLVIAEEIEIGHVSWAARKSTIVLLPQY